MKVWRPVFGRNLLKVIAVLTMLCDHFAYIFLDTQKNEMLYRGLRMIGRISFPIFCFVLVQGFLSTRNVKKYVLRLFLFALLSEIPFDLAFFHTPFYFGKQNVLFTMLIGMLVLVGVKKYETSFVREGGVMLAGCIAAYIMQTDYSYYGVILITIFYLLRYNKLSQMLWTILLTFSEGGMEVFAVIGLLFCCFYSPKKEEKRLPKYFFYAFYPLHLLFLWGIWCLV